MIEKAKAINVYKIFRNQYRIYIFFMFNSHSGIMQTLVAVVDVLVLGRELAKVSLLITMKQLCTLNKYFY